LEVRISKYLFLGWGENNNPTHNGLYTKEWFGYGIFSYWGFTMTYGPVVKTSQTKIWYCCIREDLPQTWWTELKQTPFYPHIFWITCYTDTMYPSLEERKDHF
jgi:hypothetical protein